MTTLNSTSILASIIAQNPYHIISIQGQMPMSHAENTYDFEIAEDDPHYDDMVRTEPEKRLRQYCCREEVYFGRLAGYWEN